jgi:hypothetical protein
MPVKDTTTSAPSCHREWARTRGGAVADIGLANERLVPTANAAPLSGISRKALRQSQCCRAPMRTTILLPLPLVIACAMACAAPPAAAEPVAAALPADVHLAPGGDDADDGAAGRPVATLRRALDRVREIHRTAPDRATPIVVEAAAGRYELAATLTLGPDDSGTAAAPTIVRAAAGTRPVFSGGRSITGWQVEQSPTGPRWKATLPDVAAGTWSFAQLFVNGQRRFRPVVPATGWFTIAGALAPSEAAAGKGHDRFAFAGDQLRTDWANLGDVEVVAVHRWSMSRLGIREITPPAAGEPAALSAVTLAGHTRAVIDWASFPQGHRFRAENVREALGTPGSWYLDRPTGTLTYCPLPHEQPHDAVVIAPRLDTLVAIRGDRDTGRPVTHVRFEGLTFAHGNWTLPAGGQSYPQAEIDVGAAVALDGCRHVAFERVAVVHVGRYAVGLGAGCRDCALDRCEFVDLGAGGVLVGTTGGPGSWAADRDGPGDDVTGNTIRDCSILHGGRLHPAAVGVWIGHASHTTVEHCEIADLTYTGVSVGWSWGYAPTRAHHNLVLANHIHHIGHGVLSDMGAVYTLGISPGTVVAGNVIHDIVSHEYGGWGLYTDEGSTGIVLRDNLVYRTSSGGFHQHYGRDNLVENNIFAAARDWQLQRTRVEDHTSFTFRRNVVWWNSTAPLVHGDWSQRLATDHNCYWNAAGPVTFPGGGDLAARQAAGQDADSVVADPGFADPAAGDFTLAPGSPALRLGFRPLDPAAAGRRTPATLTADLPPVPTLWPEARAATTPR